MSGLILASRSPRRCELLRRAGIQLTSYAADIDESCSLPAPEAVCELSLRKGLAVSRVYPDSYILSADTLVSLDGETLGKPADSRDAYRMLRMLSGRTHQVYTGVTVIAPSGKAFTGSDRTDVVFADLTDREINDYIDSGEPMDKAGSYALQGRAGLWVRRLEGSDSSVIGLPLYMVRDLLLRSGFPLTAYAGT